METDFFAQVGMCRSFAPIIVGHGGGAILNILSIGALFCVPEYSSYSAAKAAAAMGFSSGLVRGHNEKKLPMWLGLNPAPPTY